MDQNKVDVKVDIGVAGAQGLRDARDDVSKLGETATPADQAARKLGETLDALGAKKDAVATVRDLSNSSGALAIESAEAEFKLKQLGAAMEQAAQDARRLAAEEKAAQDAAKVSKGYLDEQRQALAALRSESSAATRQTDTYKEASKQLKVTVQELRRDVEASESAVKAAGAAARQAAAEEANLARQYEVAGKAVINARGAVDQNARALAAAESSAKSLGVQTENLTEAERGLDAELAQVRASIQAAAAAQREATAASAAAAEAERAHRAEQTALAAALKTAETERTARMAQSAAAFRSELQDRQLDLETTRQEILLERQSLLLAQQTAQANGDEAAATRLAVQLKQNEAKAVSLVASGKRAEAEAIQRVVDAERAELAALGPLSQAQERELAISGKKAQALRVEAAAADLAAARMRTLGKEGAAATAKVSEGADLAGAALGRLTPILTGLFGAQQFAGIIAEQQQLTLSYEAIFGSAQRAAQEMEFVRTTANRLGVESQVLARSYQSLAAATRGTALEGEQTRAVFEATARAMSMLGKSSVETDRALTAIAQMASKGTVAMEELRGQLGEALPGALAATAKGAGITTEQLIGMVENGQVLAKDLLPALTQGLNDLYGKGAPPQTIISEWARLKNTITDTATAVGDSGLSTAMAKAIAIQANFVKGLFQLNDTAIRAGKAFRDGGGDIAAWAREYAKFATGVRQSAEAAGLVPEALKKAEGATQAQVRAIDNLIASQQRQTTSVLAVRASYADLIKDSKAYTDLAEKVAASRQSEATLLTGLVGIYGSEQEKRRGAAEAAGMQARSLKDLADARNVEAIIAQSYSLRLQEEALKSRDNSEAKRKEIDAAKQSAAAKRAEADQAAAVAQGKSVEVAAAQAAAAAYEDNAGKVYQLRGAAVEASRELERLVALEKQGKATSDQVTAARIAEAKAIALYRDALSDATAAATRKLEQDRQQAQVVQGGISVELERANAMREVAEASGDAKAAEQARTSATQAQINAAQQSAAAARQEAADIRAVADAREAELRATGQYTAEKQAEIEAQRRSADLKDQEAQKAEILASKLLALANSDQARTDALERQISAQEKALELEERRQALEDKRLGRDKQGFSIDKAGQTINAGGATLTSVAEFLRQAGVKDEGQVKAIARQFADSKGEIQFFNNPGQKLYGGSTLSAALLKAAETVTFGVGPTSAKPASAAASEPAATHAASPAAVASPAPTPASTTYVSNVDLGDWRARLKFADRDSQKGHEELIRRLLADKGVSL